MSETNTSTVDSSEIELIANQMRDISKSLRIYYMNIIEKLERINEAVTRLESYNGQDASNEWSEISGYHSNQIITKKLIWNIKILNKYALASQNGNDLKKLEEDINSLFLYGDDLYEVSAVIRELISKIAKELSIKHDNDILNFCNKLNKNPKWTTVIEEQTLTQIFPENFMRLAHLDKYNQVGTYADWRNISIIEEDKTIKNVACGMSSYLAIRYLLAGESKDYQEISLWNFFNEAGTGSEEINHDEYGKALFNGRGASISRVFDDDYEEKYGITGNAIKTDYDTFTTELKSGKPILTLIKNPEGKPNINEGGFNPSNGQHYIVLADYNSDTEQIYVYNPHGENTGWKNKEEIMDYVINCSEGQNFSMYLTEN